jgi:hypothetical protein
MFGVIRGMCVAAKFADLVLQLGAVAVQLGLDIPDAPDALSQLMDTAKEWCESSGH